MKYVSGTFHKYSLTASTHPQQSGNEGKVAHYRMFTSLSSYVHPLLSFLSACYNFYFIFWERLFFLLSSVFFTLSFSFLHILLHNKKMVLLKLFFTINFHTKHYFLILFRVRYFLHQQQLRYYVSSST